MSYREVRGIYGCCFEFIKNICDQNGIKYKLLKKRSVAPSRENGYNDTVHRFELYSEEDYEFVNRLYQNNKMIKDIEYNSGETKNV